MAELDKRVQDSTLRKCLDVAAGPYSLAGALPTGHSISLKMQCMDNLDGGTGQAKESQLAFGLDDDNFYLFERTGGHDNAVFSKQHQKMDLVQKYGKLLIMKELILFTWLLKMGKGSSLLLLVIADLLVD